jgi:hypothetical protein
MKMGFLTPKESSSCPALPRRRQRPMRTVTLRLDCCQLATATQYTKRFARSLPGHVHTEVMAFARSLAPTGLTEYLSYFRE